ncbi:MAG: hypothetical protein F2519_05855 [Actinobacteria bacterium]|uniref:Unannotated protein n=1 Tax=freshwater metagenome TaxID=449393 RepID=A0A6J7QWB9_9ZZZZ|nr:hypothetical protein [Actinomycetota bacterium]MSW15307.1 hypothetical protein [Actinomycetota bacterium]MSY82610.1 hypothetical protein [Actinomycetota bacterium]MTA05081.1 hypothetical protein [Actinomycetota bacterium]MTA23213.1 hypothetical protein [Actinomycetota bacterium]
MKKIALILLVLTFSRVAVAYAVDTTPGADSGTATSDNYFFGDNVPSSANLNQVLALLVGPKGDVGPAGVAGKDGFVGLNGQDGKDGLDGAPGAVGPAGRDGKDGANGLPGATGPAGPAGSGGGGSGGGVGLFAVIPIALNTSDCNGLGGTKIIGVDGTPNFVCNGAVGANSYSLGFADGTVALGNCQPSAETVTVTVDRAFDGEEFRFTSFNFGNLSTLCAGKRLSVNMKMVNPVSAGKYYLSNDQVVCTTVIATPPANPTRIIDGSSTCRPWRGSPLIEDTTTAFSVSDINTLDFTGAFGFQLRN